MKKLLTLLLLSPLAIAGCSTSTEDEIFPPEVESTDPADNDRGITSQGDTDITEHPTYVGDKWYRVVTNGYHGDITFEVFYDSTTLDLTEIDVLSHTEDKGANALLPERMNYIIEWTNDGTLEDKIPYTGASNTHRATVRAINYVLSEMKK